MRKILRILFSTRRALLASPDLIALCALAQRFRAICAITCVASFLGVVAIVMGYRALPFEMVLLSIGGLLLLFIVSATLATRFGRLANAQQNQGYNERITYLIEINPRCAEYAQSVAQQGRPLTEIDLDELGAIHRASGALNKSVS
jgi:hypothetical protein